MKISLCEKKISFVSKKIRKLTFHVCEQCNFFKHRSEEIRDYDLVILYHIEKSKMHCCEFNSESHTMRKKLLFYHPKFFLWLLWLKIQRLISRFITSFMLKFMLNYAICSSEANRTIVGLIAKQLKCMKKRSQLAIYRRVVFPSPQNRKKMKFVHKIKLRQNTGGEFWILNNEHMSFTEGTIQSE